MKGKHIVAIFFAVIAIFVTFASVHASGAWVKHYNGQYNERGRAITPTSDGGYATAGHIYTGQGGTMSVFVMRLGPKGDIVWQKKYHSDGFSNATANAIIETSDGGYLVSAYCDRFLLLLKVAADGSLSWSRYFYSLEAAATVSLLETADKCIFVAGSRSYKHSGPWVVKLDRDGKTLWSKSYGYNDTVQFATATSEGGLVLGGQGVGGAILTRLDSAGNVQWHRSYSGSGTAMVTSMTGTSDGGYLLAGYLNRSASYVNWIAKLSASGEIEWQKEVNTIKTWGAAALEVADKNYIYTDRDMPLLIRFDAAGNVVWSNSGALYGRVEGMKRTTDGGFVAISSLGAYSYYGVFRFSGSGVPLTCMPSYHKAQVAEATFTSSVQYLATYTKNFTGTPVTLAVSDSAMTIEEVCAASDPKISAVPSAIDFGAVRLGRQREELLRISNVGDGDLAVSGISLAGANGNEFKLIHGCGSVPPGDSCTATITFTPSAAGTKTASVAIASNDPTYPTLAVPLSGVATTPAIAVSPVALHFPGTELGYSSVTSLTISNSGSANLNVSSYQLSGANAAEFTLSGICEALVPAQSCQVSAVFRPSGLGSRKASLVISSDDPARPEIAVPFEGEGIDTIKPVLAVSVTGAAGNDGWIVSDAEVSITATDSGSGVQFLRYAADGASQTVVAGSSAAILLAETGIYSVACSAEDFAENVADAPPVTVKVDKMPPTTVLASTGERGTDDWYRSAVSISLSAADVGSGVAAIHYSTNGGQEMLVAGETASFTILAEGSHSIIFHSSDKAGNAETLQAATVKIDATAPESSLRLAGVQGAGDWYKGEVTGTVRATDSGSGIAAIRYSVDGGPETVVSGDTASFVISAEGDHSVTYRAVDRAGNMELPRTAPLKIDSAAPRTTIDISGSKGAAGWFAGPVTVSLAAGDAFSGVAEIRYRIDNGSETVVSGSSATFTISSEGDHLVTFQAIDAAGNVEPLQSSKIRIDNTPPTLAINLSRSILWPVNHKLVDVVVGGGASDSGSGIVSVEITVTDEYGVYSGTLGGFGSRVRLEAWREGNDLDGRHYTITAVAVDAAGNRITSSTEVVVPHDMR